MSIVEPYREFVQEKRAEGVEIRALHALLRERAFEGSYSSVKRFVARLEEHEPEKFLRLETAPAEEAQVDFGYAGEVHDASSGRKRKAWIFVMTLSYSRHQFVEAVFDQSVETWTALHVRAFEHFGGVPGRIVVDNLKAAIVRAVLHDPEPQRSYRELAEHYEFLISPCRPRTPRHKGKVESGVRYVKRNALAGRDFASLQAMNVHLAKWVREVAGIRQHGTVYEQPLERFERERDELKALPAERFEVRSWKKAKVHRDCHVVFDYSHYSIPHRFVGREVWLRVTAERVEAFHEHERVTSHSRAKERGEWVSNKDHYPPEKLKGLLPEPVHLRTEAERVGERTAEFIDRLLGDQPIDRLRGARSTLRLQKRFGASRLEAACDRALNYDQISVRTIKSILEKDLDLESSGGIVAFPGPLPKTSRFARPAFELMADY